MLESIRPRLQLEAWNPNTVAVCTVQETMSSFRARSSFSAVWGECGGGFLQGCSRRMVQRGLVGGPPMVDLRARSHPAQSESQKVSMHLTRLPLRVDSSVPSNLGPKLEVPSKYLTTLLAPAMSVAVALPKRLLSSFPANGTSPLSKERYRRTPTVERNCVCDTSSRTASSSSIRCLTQSVETA